MKQFFAVIILMVLIISLGLVISCSEDTETENQRTTCSQATDCGSEGRLAWVCSAESLCYKLSEYCLSDDECNGSCVEHICENGLIDNNTEDGDSEQVTDGDDESTVCIYACCKDDDCPAQARCDLNTHTCVFDTVCNFECCSNNDCLGDASFGEGYICRFNKCILEDAPCDTECCESTDCEDGYFCDMGKCITEAVNCSPFKEICCESNPVYPACIELGTLAKEAKLICNGNGNGYTVEMCPTFNDCIDMGDGTTDCFPNGGCNGNDDCACPKICVEIEGKKSCVPVSLESGAVCYADVCSTGEPMISGRCPNNHTCCFDDKVNPTSGTCTLTAECDQ